MDYEALAVTLLDNMQTLSKAAPQKRIDEALRGESFVLHYLASHGEEALPGEIGEEMNVSTARIAQTLNSIEKKGWITRQIDLRDRRKILVKLTPEGKSAANRQYKKIIVIAAAMLSLLGEYDAQEYVRISRILAQRISENAQRIQSAAASL